MAARVGRAKTLRFVIVTIGVIAKVADSVDHIGNPNEKARMFDSGRSDI